MPLVKSGSKSAVSENIRRERSAGKPQKQAIAIALSVARRARKAEGGAVADYNEAARKILSRQKDSTDLDMVFPGERYDDNATFAAQHRIINRLNENSKTPIYSRIPQARSYGMANGGEVDTDPFQVAAERTRRGIAPRPGYGAGLATVGKSLGDDLYRQASIGPRMWEEAKRPYMLEGTQTDADPTAAGVTGEGIGTMALNMLGPRPKGSIGSGGGEWKKPLLPWEKEKSEIEKVLSQKTEAETLEHMLVQIDSALGKDNLGKGQKEHIEDLVEAFGEIKGDTKKTIPEFLKGKGLAFADKNFQDNFIFSLKKAYPSVWSEIEPPLNNYFGVTPKGASGPGQFASKASDWPKKEWDDVLPEHKIDLNDFTKPINDTAAKFMEQWKSYSMPKSEELRRADMEKHGYTTSSYRGVMDRPEIPELRGDKDIFSTPNPRLANMYASMLDDINQKYIAHGAQIMPLMLDTSKYVRYDAKGSSWVMANGHARNLAHKNNAPGVIIENVHDTPAAGPKGDYSTGEGANTVYLTLGNKGKHTIKSKFARFDEIEPGKSNLINTIGGMGVVGTGGAILIKPKEKEEFAMGGSVDRTARKYASGGLTGADDVAGYKERQAIHRSVGAGMLKSPVPGRTDKLPIAVPSGSYVVPADIVSGLGQGNSDAGNQILAKMFNSGPMGMKPMKGGKSGQKGRLRTGKVPKAGKISAFADGGPPEGDGEVPIIAAGGEVILTPDQVAHVGGGDVGHGHEVLDAFVKHARKQIISTMKKLPGPSK